MEGSETAGCLPNSGLRDDLTVRDLVMLIHLIEKAKDLPGGGGSEDERRVAAYRTLLGRKLRDLSGGSDIRRQIIIEIDATADTWAANSATVQGAASWSLAIIDSLISRSREAFVSAAAIALAAVEKYDETGNL